MSTDEYVPDEEAMEVAWIEFEASAEGINDASAEFDRFLARVRRDAAREALDGLAENMTRIANESPDALTRASATITAQLAGEYKTNVYPEETP